MSTTSGNTPSATPGTAPSTTQSTRTTMPETPRTPEAATVTTGPTRPHLWATDRPVAGPPVLDGGRHRPVRAYGEAGTRTPTRRPHRAPTHPATQHRTPTHPPA
ncbi:hypothetical protein [Actinacidiphila glaucinigra]|uniref:hypothetical protein n=1 Tax=Actinacidiphila glaucinigra TaxID=235986 RepID=UPI002E2F8FE0|nr:hypothetical protein [Actinacidiphila glaucinigra]